MHDGAMGWGWAVMGMVWMVVFWGAIIGLIVWGVRKFTDRPQVPSTPSPLDIAKERYARGEISQEQYEGWTGL
jgi:putative membrane protein